VFERDETGAACLGGVRLEDLLRQSRAEGEPLTPAYVYDLDAIVEEADALARAFGSLPSLVAFALKANSAGPILRALARRGVGADVVSGGELQLALAAGITPDDVVYSGVAKRDDELDLAVRVGARGVASFHVESLEELPRVAARARASGRTARVSLRVNPGLEADTHAYIATGHDEAKFGIAREELPAAIEAVVAHSELELVGLSTHIGSQLTSVDTYVAAARMLLQSAQAIDVTLASSGRPALTMLDFGGGFGIDYGAGCDVRPADFATALVRELQRVGATHRRTVVEPGRSLVAAHGVLCATTIQVKHSVRAAVERRWLLIDAGMNDLLRPALYQARHRIEPVDQAPSEAGPHYRVAGPVCESSDDFGEHRFAQPPARVVVRDAGAYGFTMASEYNARPLPREIFVSAGRVCATLSPGSTDAWLRRRLDAKTPANR
jgi:diaminopimelate decarboxylase